MDNVDNSSKALNNKDLAVEKPVEITTRQTTIIKQKQNIININVDEEFIENNLIDMPFIYYYKSKEPITAVKYYWFSNDKRQRSIEVRASKHGVPSPYEYKVLLALFRILLKNHKDKLVYSEKQEKYLIDNKIRFTFRELAKEMGYKNFGGSIKKKLDDAIERLKDTSIYNTSSGGLYDPIKKRYILDEKMAIGIIHNYKTYSYVEDKDGNRKLDKKSIKDKAYVTVDEFFLNNLCYGKGKISDKKVRLSLKNDLAQRLYLILNKWRNSRSEMYLTYEKLYERIPLDDTKSNSYRNKRIIQASDELVDKGYLKEYVRNRKGINFIFKNIKKLKSSQDDTGSESKLLKKYVTFDELMEGLSKNGLSKKEINDNFKLYQVPYVQALLRYVEDNSYRINDIRKYILKGLNKEYQNIPEKYFDIIK